MTMKKHLLLIGVFLTVTFSYTTAQISTEEKPISFTLGNVVSPRKNIVIQMPAIDLAKLEKEDIADEKYGIPPRFGFPHKVNFNLKNSGEWTTLSGGDRLWRLEIYCPGALSINLIYDNFWIPEGGKFFVYSKDKKYTLGAFTSKNNKGNKGQKRGFSTGLVYSEHIVLEYYQPKTVQVEADISINYITQGYRYITINGSKTRANGFGNSRDCNININCPEGIDFQDEKRAIALILMNWGSRACTGSLLRSTDSSFEPLFLTANHCLSKTEDAVSNSNLDSWMFYWNYEEPSCSINNHNNITADMATSGATILSNSADTDFALLKLSEDPNKKRGVIPYFLGWSRSGNVREGVAIHHPVADPKKISFANNIKYHNKTIDWTDGTNSPKYTHWSVNFYNGTTEGGSSGSPLFDREAKVVIGQLHGGRDGCAPITKYYGRFDISWNGYGNPTDKRRRLKDWLDPNNTNRTAISGAYAMNIIVSENVCNDSQINIDLKNYPLGSIIKWIDDPNFSIVSGQGTQTVTIKTSSNYNGYATIKVNVTTGKDSQTIESKKFWIGKPQPELSSDHDKLVMPGYGVSVICNKELGQTLNWTISGGNISVYKYPNYETASCNPNRHNYSMCVSVNATNACGTSANSIDFIVYKPGPGDPPIAEKSAPLPSVKLFEIYSFPAGRLVHKCSSENFNINNINIPDGIYIIYSTDINGENPASEKVIKNNY